MADEAVGCNSAEKHIRLLVRESVQRALKRDNIYLSDRNYVHLLDGAADEAVQHERLSHLEVRLEPKRWWESAGIRGSSIGFIASLSALLLLLFMPPGLTRDAVVASLTVFSVIGGIVGIIGRKRAKRRIL